MSPVHDEGFVKVHDGHKGQRSNQPLHALFCNLCGTQNSVPSNIATCWLGGFQRGRLAAVEWRGDLNACFCGDIP
jgi:hypothetical protein